MTDHLYDICVAFDGNAGATLSVSGDLAGQVNPPPATLYSTGISGISIPLYVAVCSNPHTMDSSSHLMAESLM